MIGTVAIASRNPVKRAAVHLAFSSVFPGSFKFTEYEIDSGVSNQPLSDIETRQGAFNRANNLRARVDEADFFVGVEGGVEDRAGEMFQFSWVVVLSKYGRMGVGRSGMFMLPPTIRSRILHNKMELGAATDAEFGVTNTKQKGGIVAYLTNGVIDRTEMYRHAAVYALIPFVRDDLYR